MEDRDQNIANILKHIKGLRKDIREMRKSMDSASKMVFTNQEIMEQLDVSTAVLKKWRDSGLLGYSQINNKYYYSRNDILEFMQTTHYEAFVTRKKYIVQ